MEAQAKENVPPRSRRGGRVMHLSHNLSHWVCLLAGLYLALTGLLLRDIVAASPVPAASPADSRRSYRAASVGKRVFLVAIGLAAFGYGLSRIL